MTNDRILDAIAIWEELSANPDALFAYRSRMKQIKDEESAVREAELREQAALEEGIAKGIEHGAQTNKEKTARKLLQKNISIEDVAEYTELSIEKIETLREEMGLS